MHSQISWGLLGLGWVLGLRHGIDWDHIAAISDITSSAVQNDRAENDAPSTFKAAPNTSPRRLVLEAFWLSTLYALGHALMVVGLGLLALWASAIVPAWFDPLMERIVGVTLLILGFWVFYSLWRYGTSFRLQSRWMLVFGLVARGWHALGHKLTGREGHSHEVPQQFQKYGPLAAFFIGIIHGFGAETGSQALLLASVAGVSSRGAGSLLLVAFVCGLLMSNSLVAMFSLAGFISSLTRRRVYTGISIAVGAFSLFVGSFFVTGRGDSLPDLQKALGGATLVMVSQEPPKP